MAATITAVASYTTTRGTTPADAVAAWLSARQADGAAHRRTPSLHDEYHMNEHYELAV
jgi:hypothetical protein